MCLRSLDDLEAFTVVVEGLRKQTSFAVFTSLIKSSAQSQYASESSPVLVYIRVFIYVVVILISLVGNLLVIVTICLDRLMMSKATNYFMLNLALCDLAILVSCMWVEVVLSFNKYWILGETFCKVNPTNLTAQLFSFFYLGKNYEINCKVDFNFFSQKTNFLVFCCVIWAYKFNLILNRKFCS